MPTKKMADGHRIKREVLVAIKRGAFQVLTADFVAPAPTTIKVIDGAQRSMKVSSGGIDIADLNKSRLGLKPPSSETTTPEKKELTQ